MKNKLPAQCIFNSPLHIDNTHVIYIFIIIAGNWNSQEEIISDSVGTDITNGQTNMFWTTI